VAHLSTKERILVIRILEKLARNPECGKMLGMEPRNEELSEKKGNELTQRRSMS